MYDHYLNSMVYRLGVEEGRSHGDMMWDTVIMREGMLEYFVNIGAKTTLKFSFTKFSKTQLNFVELHSCILEKDYQTKINLLGYFSFDGS